MKKLPKEEPRIKKSCLILGSISHFNPLTDTELSKTSAGLILQEIYTTVKSIDYINCFYLDRGSIRDWERLDVDILITYLDDIKIARWFFKPNKIYLIAVNQHPIERLKLLREAKKAKIPFEGLNGSDGIYQPIFSATNFNGVLCVGNKVTIDSYTKYYRNLKIYNSFYTTNIKPRKSLSISSINSNTVKILVVASSLNFRKGLDKVIELIDLSNKLNLDFEFNLLGYTDSKFWAKKLEFLLQTSRNLKFHGYVNNKDDEFIDLLKNSDLAVFFSRPAKSPARESGPAPRQDSELPENTGKILTYNLNQPEFLSEN